MGILLGSVSRCDARIAQELTRYLPGQPLLVGYLDRAIRAQGGTVFVARILGSQLAQETKFKFVHRKDINQLALHEDESAIAAFVPELRRIYPVALDQMFIVGLRLYQRMDHIAPHHRRRDTEQLIVFMRIYLCALAMLVGVTTRPFRTTFFSPSGQRTE